MKKEQQKSLCNAGKTSNAKTLVELKARYFNTDTLYHISGQKSSKEGEKP